MEDRKLIELSQLLVNKNSQIGVLEAQNNLLKLKLRLTLREIDLRDHKIPSNYDREKFITPELKSRYCQTENESNNLPPKTPLTSRYQEDFLADSPQVTELSNTLSNLKWGFKKREDGLKQQLENYKEALQTLYHSYEKLRKQYHHICNLICNQLDETESYVNQRKDQTTRLEEREKELFVLWEKLKQLEARTQSDGIHKIQSSKDDDFDEDGKIIKRSKSDDFSFVGIAGLSKDGTLSISKSLSEESSLLVSGLFKDGNLAVSKSLSEESNLLVSPRSQLKRKHNETAAQARLTSPTPVLPFPATENVQLTAKPVAHIDETTLLSMSESNRAKDDLFYSQLTSRKEFGVGIDFLLPQNSKSAGMMLGNSDDSEDKSLLHQSSDGIPESFRREEKSKDTLSRSSDENENDDVVDEEEISPKEPTAEEDDLRTTGSFNLEDLQQSPIHAPDNSLDENSDVDSVDSLYGLQAMLSPNLPANQSSSSSSKLFHQTVSQNLFGSDHSSSSKLRDTSFEISSDKEALSKDALGESGTSIFKTSSQPPSSTLPPSRKKQIETAEFSTQTEDHIVSSIVVATNTDIISLRNEAVQARENEIIYREIEVNTDVSGSVLQSAAKKQLRDQIIEANIPIIASTDDRTWTSDDEAYFEEMETIQFQLGERLIELDFEKEQAMNELKSNMKSTILLSIHQRSSSSDLPTTIDQNPSAESLSKKQPSQEEEQESQDAALLLLKEDKVILEKRVFTLQEKIRNLEKEKQSITNDLQNNQSSYQTAAELQQVKINELEKKNQQLISMISELHVKKVSSEVAIQTDKRKKKASKPHVIRMDGTEQEDVEEDGEQEEEEDGDDDSEDDELSRLLFQKNYTLSNSRLQSIGKMEVYRTTSVMEPTLIPNAANTSAMNTTNNISSIRLEESTILLDSSTLTESNLQRNVTTAARGNPTTEPTTEPVLLSTSVRKPSIGTQRDIRSEEIIPNEDENSLTSYSIEEKSSLGDVNNLGTSAFIQEQVTFYPPSHHPNPIPHPTQFNHTGFASGHHHPAHFQEFNEDDSNRNIFHDGNTIVSSSMEEDEFSQTYLPSNADTESENYENYLTQQFEQFENEFDREIASVIQPNSADLSRIGPPQGIAFSKDYIEDEENPDDPEENDLITAEGGEDDEEDVQQAAEAIRQVQHYLEKHEENSAGKSGTKKIPSNDYTVKENSLLSESFTNQRKKPRAVDEDPSSTSHQSVNLESFEMMRLEWENQQLLSKQNDLTRENQKLSRELELYRTKIFTIVQTEQTNANHHPHLLLQDLPDINITFQEGHQFQYLSQTTTSSQTLYIIHQLITNNNNLIDRLQYSELQQQRYNNSLQEKEAEVDYLKKELSKHEIQNNRMKSIISQASNTITITEQDYQILQKQVEILTKKLQLVMIENQKLSSYYHSSYSSSVISPPSSASKQQQQQQQLQQYQPPPPPALSLTTDTTRKEKTSSHTGGVSNYHPDPLLLSAKKEKIIADLLSRTNFMK